MYLTESQLLADTEVVVVPPNQVYYIGDNQENSIDSRHTGTVPMSSIIGIVKVKFRRQHEYIRMGNKDMPP